MNTSTIARVINGQSFRRSIIAAGALLIAGGVALGLARWATISTAPTAVPPMHVHTLTSASSARYEDFKLRQVDRPAAGGITTAPAVARQHYEDFKLRQVDQVTAAAPRAVVTTAARTRYAEFKLRQVERAEAKFGGIASVVSPTHEGFDDFKRRQIEQIEVGIH